MEINKYLNSLNYFMISYRVLRSVYNYLAEDKNTLIMAPIQKIILFDLVNDTVEDCKAVCFYINS